MSLNGSGIPMMVVDFSQADNMKYQIDDEMKEAKEASKGALSDDNKDVSLREPLNEDECEDQDGSESENSNDRKKRRRRRLKGGKHHRKWKPYNKLSWNERKVLDEKESKKATQKREEAFANGHPVAPYNTTQFLMEDHIKHESISPKLNVEEAQLNRHNSRESTGGSRSGGSDSSDEYYSSPDDEKDFLEKEFAETYDNIHAEQLMNMSKEELVKRYLELEAKLTNLQKIVKRKFDPSGGDSSGSLSSSGEEFQDLDEVKNS